MAIRTTTIGAWPKPAYVPIRDWFGGPESTDTPNPTAGYARALAMDPDALEALLARGVAEAIADQVAAGIDVPTDGEIRRENYIHYHCRHLDGIDFQGLTERAVRGGNYTALLPTVRAPVRAAAPFLPHDWRVAQGCTGRPVKVTLPGPMTIADTVADAHYNDARALGADLAAAINAEVMALARAGCTHIQIDEPVFARKPREALDHGFAHLDRCFAGLPEGVTRTVHICCGYPNGLDLPDYPKADRRAYLELAEAIDGAAVDLVSLEDAHRPNDLADLLPRFGRVGVVLGVVKIASSRVEAPSGIEARLREARRFVEPERLWAAPDCGLGLLGRDLAMRKLHNLSEAARRLT